ncbi:large conductance mechanosensitive channel protein MscL [Pseudonocardia sp. KRD291]|uniref:large conductance mechanosensitive channel protein MscL n=1 Tax=Pseudonocardia sp. KRD291 TaxID=2792007 RepID=UPI001C4A30D9|nr:large conductance mechanosensitive channel protein MscL [Pseudonocardia sp. KRD291]
MLKGFKDFLLRGNVIDLAVAVVIGAAFTSVVTAFTNAFLKPLIQLFSGGGEFAGKIVVKDVEFDYATFINSTITFMITAAVVYFFVVYPMKWLQERRRRGEEDGPAESTDIELLTEIRDLLQAQAEAAPTAPAPAPGERTTRLTAQAARPRPDEQDHLHRRPRSRHGTGEPADAPRR